MHHSKSACTCPRWVNSPSCRAPEPNGRNGSRPAAAPTRQKRPLCLVRYRKRTGSFRPSSAGPTAVAHARFGSIPDLGLSPESRPSDRSAWRDLVKFREGWIAGVATYQAEPHPRPVETRVEHDGAWRDLRVGRKAYWAIEGARRERLRYRPATPSPGTRPKS